MDKLNQWLSVIANLGVVIGLIVVVFELRQNSSLMQAEAYDRRVANILELNILAIDQAHLTEALNKLEFPGGLCFADTAPLEDLSPEESVAFSYFVYSQIIKFQNVNRQFHLGLIPDREHNGSLVPAKYYGIFAERLSLPQAGLVRDMLNDSPRELSDFLCRHADA